MKALWKSIERHEWSLLILLTVISMGLGLTGFRLWFVAAGETASFWDLLYLTIQLFTMESGAPGGEIPFILNVARYLAPATLAIAAVKTFFWLLGDQIRQFRMRNVKGHVVVCGANSLTTRLIRNLLEQGDHMRVIVVDRIISIPDDLRRHRHLLAIAGDPLETETLQEARIAEAECLICMDQDPHVNLTITAAVLNQERNACLSVYCHLDNPRIIEQFYTLDFLQHMTPKESNSQVRVQVFNLKERAARLILREYPPDLFHPELHSSDRQAHVAMAGLGTLGEALILQIARMCHFGNLKKTRLTVVDDRPSLWDQILESYPNLAEILDLVYLPEITPELLQQKIEVFYLCPDQDTDSLQWLKKLYPADKQPFPIVVCVQEEESFLQYYRGSNLHHFNLPAETLTVESVLKEAIDRLARVIHTDYLEKQHLNQTFNPDKATHRNWEDLPEKTRSQNRNQADHLFVKVRAAGARIVSLTDPGEALDFTAQPLLERLAEAEHNRWMAHELLYDEARSHVSLVPYDQLSEEVKQYDRDAIANIPALLARLGMKPVKPYLPNLNPIPPVC